MSVSWLELYFALEVGWWPEALLARRVPASISGPEGMFEPQSRGAHRINYVDCPMSLYNPGKLLWEISSWKRDLERSTFEEMGGIERKKSSSRHHFPRSHYFFICISFHYQSFKKKARLQLCNGLCSCYEPESILWAVCESAHPWLPALRATGGTGNFSNVHKNVKREFWVIIIPWSSCGKMQSRFPFRDNSLWKPLAMRVCICLWCREW